MNLKKNQTQLSSVHHSILSCPVDVKAAGWTYKSLRALRRRSQRLFRLRCDLRSRRRRHEASLPAPAPLLRPPLITPPPRRRQTAHPPRLAGWQRPPPDAAAGGRAPQGGRRRRQHRLGSAGRKHPEGAADEEPGPSAATRRGERGSGSEGGGAAVETQRGAAAVHRPDLPPAQEYDADGQDGEPEGAGRAQPQSARRDREVKLDFFSASLKQPNRCLSIQDL